MKYFLGHEQLDDLLQVLVSAGYSCIGPQVRDGAIVYDELTAAEQLPWGIQDQQLPGSYQLHKTDLPEAFAWSNGPQAIKPFTFKPQESLWKVERDDHDQLVFKEITAVVKPVAVIGARACDLAALAVQDKVFIESEYVDQRYLARRRQLFIIAVNCNYSGGNCFCVSTNTGPQADSGFDLAFTEITHGFVVEIGSEKGRNILAPVNCEAVTASMLEQAQQNTERARSMQTKRMPYHNSQALRDILMNKLDDPRWDEVAERCLSCGNCTSVCPTCFCHHETETPDLNGNESIHAREWDSCFSSGHSYIHGKIIRKDTKSRYKQWLTHKIATWWDQFDTSGCIGCGRCITWCPVGIDITEEVAALSGDSNVCEKEEV